MTYGFFFYIIELSDKRGGNKMNFQKTSLKRKMEVGEYAHSVFQNQDLQVLKEQTGKEAGFPHIAQVNTYVYYVNGVAFMSKVDVDSNKVLDTQQVK